MAMKLGLLVSLVAIAGVVSACETVQTAPPAKHRVVRMAPIPDDEGSARAGGHAKLVAAANTTRTVPAGVSASKAVTHEAVRTTPAPEPAATPTPAPDTSAAASAPAAPAPEPTPAPAPDASASAPATTDTTPSTAEAAPPAATTPPAPSDIVADSSTVAATPTSAEPAKPAAAPALALDPATWIAANINGFPIWLIAVVALALIGALAIGMSGGGRKARTPYTRNEPEPEVEHEAEPEMV
jgi:hypothetical protein